MVYFECVSVAVASFPVGVSSHEHSLTELAQNAAPAVDAVLLMKLILAFCKNSEPNNTTIHEHLAAYTATRQFYKYTHIMPGFRRHTFIISQLGCIRNNLIYKYTYHPPQHWTTHAIYITHMGMQCKLLHVPQCTFH